MQISLLGPVEVTSDGRPVAIGRGKPRALLAVLALHEGSTVSSDRLVEALWGEDPPPTAAKMVQLYVSQVRKALAVSGDGAEIVTHGRGYELRLGDGAVDALRFEALVADDMPREALALWRGAPLADVAEEPFADGEIRRLEELHLTTLERAIERDLAAGRHREVLGELQALVAREPLREGLQAQRMLALYRSGHQAQALQAYRKARSALVEQIGVEPGPDLRELHDAILRQDPELDPPGVESEPLPAELYAGTPLAGRQAELDILREAWREAHAGAGRFVLVVGTRGMGKTRLAAELAGEVHRDRGIVLYASGAGDPGAGREAMSRAGRAQRPTLLVVDDVDRAGDEVGAALRELVEGLDALTVLVLATAQDSATPLSSRADVTIALGALGADDVAALARLYADPREDAEVPVASLIEATGGVPREVHQAAIEWSRAERVRRLGGAAGRTASRRAGLRAAEDELAGDVVVALEAARERGLHGADVVVCPFKGLAAFEPEDAAFFFGREQLVAEMVARLAGAPLLGLVGPSGSGKSSVLRAGLLPALRQGVLPGSEAWAIALLRPGEHPLRALHDAISAAAPEGRLLLAVDQLEEAFVACRDERERAAFMDALVRSARDPRRRAVVLVAVRADFYGRCAAYPELWRLLGANQTPVGPMRRDELRSAIELPARHAGLEVEPDLTRALIDDVEGEPGALPLLSTCLLELWQHRDGRLLRLAAYQASGGVHGAVARLAERAYGRLDAAGQRMARAVLLRLAGEGEGEAVVRTRVALEEFGDDARPVLDELTDSRLLTVTEGDVEVAHEALLREWPRLRGWLEDDAEGRRLHRHLRAAASEWAAGGRDRGELYRGARLAAARDWAADHDPELAARERAFLDESASASGRAHRRLRMVLAGVAALLVVAVIAGAIALNERGNARREAVAADAQRLGAQALSADDLDRSLLLARQGVALDDSLQTRGNLLAALLKSPAAIGVVRGDGDSLIDLDLSPDGRTLAYMEDDGTLRFVDARTRRAVAPPVPVPGYAPCTIASLLRFDQLHYSPDRSRIAIGGCEPVILDAATHRAIAHLQVGRDALVYGLRFAPDGRTLYAVGRFDGRLLILRFDGRTGRRLSGAARWGGDGFATAIPTPDGRAVVTADSPERGTVVRDARTLRALRRIPAGAQYTALSPNGHTLLLGGADGSVRFADLRTGSVRLASGRHDGVVERGIFSADGRFAVTAATDRQIILWDVRHAAESEALGGHHGRITALAISRDDSTLYSSALDGEVLIWDLKGAHRLGRRFTVGLDRLSEIPRYALSPDGRILAVGRPDGRVGVFDMGTLRRLSLFPVVPGAAVAGMGWIPRSDLMVVGSDDGSLALVDPLRGRVVKRLYRYAADTRIFTPGISADGHVMVTGASDETVRVWALPSGREIGARLKFRGGIGDVSMSPDGRRFAVAGIEGTDNPGVQIFDVATHRRVGALSQDESIWSLARFTPDGRYIVGGSFEGWVRLWSTKTWKPATRILRGHAGEVLWESMSPDGRTLATGGFDGTVRLWDLPTQREVGAPLPGLPGRLTVPQFTPDGRSLLAITDAGRAYLWDVRSSSWLRHACAVAGRTLTRAEWQDVLPGRAYAPACVR
jgi:WD40 repeat protein/DNA-binding SARP family transcriptional activator/energy-coupling factor transporter ATP-binding protein EcfA2